ncbi:hypothetical protein [Pontibacter russatus]|uniref:hypothetical protein n=1 Tax=Pontibacter russatus TaxID=2694929 RepID=UPI00137AF445|nr:hypothetical protein [Pontibacter russatus]
MDNTVLVGIVTASCTLIGVAFTALATRYSAIQKIKEIEITYRQKLQEGYLSNARQQIGNVYAPLNIILSKLIENYVDFSNNIEFENAMMDKSSEDKFRQSCNEYLTNIKGLIDRGADAYLTNQLEIYLRAFTSFIRESLRAETPKLKVVPNYISFSPFFLPLPKNQEMFFEGKWAKFFNEYGLSFLGYGISFEKELVGAPVNSPEFQKKITNDVYNLKSLIKEVTLGARDML